MILRGGPLDGKEITPATRACTYSFPVVEDCGRMCGPHFSQWNYRPDGTLASASTWLGDWESDDVHMLSVSHHPDWPTGDARFADDAPIGYFVE
jgi:hypothetical protein